MELRSSGSGERGEGSAEVSLENLMLSHGHRWWQGLQGWGREKQEAARCRSRRSLQGNYGPMPRRPRRRQEVLVLVSKSHKRKRGSRLPRQGPYKDRTEKAFSWGKPISGHVDLEGTRLSEVLHMLGPDGFSSSALRLSSHGPSPMDWTRFPSTLGSVFSQRLSGPRTRLGLWPDWADYMAGLTLWDRLFLRSCLSNWFRRSWFQSVLNWERPENVDFFPFFSSPRTKGGVWALPPLICMSFIQLNKVVIRLRFRILATYHWTRHTNNTVSVVIL